MEAKVGRLIFFGSNVLNTFELPAKLQKLQKKSILFSCVTSAVHFCQDRANFARTYFRRILLLCSDPKSIYRQYVFKQILNWLGRNPFPAMDKKVSAYYNRTEHFTIFEVQNLWTDDFCAIWIFRSTGFGGTKMVICAVGWVCSWPERKKIRIHIT